MTKVTTFVVDGTNVTVAADVFTEYTQESYGILRKIEILNEEFKELVEVVSDTTKLDKKHVSKYLKARFKLSTKEPKAQAEIFEALDSVLEA
jgi:hypothetical protein